MTIIFPSLEEFTGVFYGCNSELSYENSFDRIESVLRKSDLEKDKQQDIYLFDDPRQVLQRLYSVGFVGIHNEQSASFVFCHDGKDPDRAFAKDTRLLIHPCYWLALSTIRATLTLGEAEDIHDEYDIEISSETKNQRNKIIEMLLQEVSAIEEGASGSHDFESWCLKALKIIFVGAH